MFGVLRVSVLTYRVTVLKEKIFSITEADEEDAMANEARVSSTSEEEIVVGGY